MKNNRKDKQNTNFALDEILDDKLYSTESILLSNKQNKLIKKDKDKNEK